MIGHTLDVADRENVGTFFDWAHQRLGKVDILIQSAGINIPNRSMEAMQPSDWDRVLGINTTGAYNCAYAVLPGMRERRDGLIVFISSVSGRRATALGGVAYTAAKFAQTALGKAIALEVGELGIRVTNVCPGEVNTPILDDRPTPVSDEHKARILQPQDLADAVLMVACLPPRAHISELVIKPTWQEYT